MVNDNPCPHSSAGSTHQGGDCPWAIQMAMAGSNYFQALGSDDESDQMPRRNHVTPTPTTPTSQLDKTYPPLETFAAAVGATPLEETNALTTRGICGLLREQAQAADAALADFHREVWDLA